MGGRKKERKKELLSQTPFHPYAKVWGTTRRNGSGKRYPAEFLDTQQFSRYGDSFWWYFFLFVCSFFFFPPTSQRNVWGVEMIICLNCNFFLVERKRVSKKKKSLVYQSVCVYRFDKITHTLLCVWLLPMSQPFWRRKRFSSTVVYQW
jgi:hypothetical protein